MKKSEFLYPILSAFIFAFVFFLNNINTTLGILLGLIIGHFYHKISILQEQVQALIPKQQPVSNDNIDQAINITTPKQQNFNVQTYTSTPPVIAPTKINIGLQKILNIIKGYFTTGNIVVKAGIIILLFGIGFLLQYAAHNGWLPLSVRLIIAATFSIILFIIGYHLRQRKRDYGLALQGGAIGIIYLLIYISFALYHLLTPYVAFSLICITSIFTICFALLEDALSLALFALAGAMLAPYFIANQALTTVIFFSYYTIINLVILTLACFKFWRALSKLGFWFTFLAGSLWGFYHYSPEHLIITETFLTSYFLIYVAIAVINVYRQPGKQRMLIDVTLVFGVPIVYFGLQEFLLDKTAYGLAICAAILTLVYGGLSYIAYQLKYRISILLAEAFAGLALVFLSLSIPYAFNLHFTIMTWALESALLIWLGVKQARFFIKLLGIILLSISNLTLINEIGSHLICFNLLFTSAASFSGSYCLIALYRRIHHKSNAYHDIIGSLFFIWALLSWLLAGNTLINEYFSHYTLAANLIYFSLSCMSACYLQKFLDWNWLKLPALLILAVIGANLLEIFGATLNSIDILNPIANFAGVGWLFAFISLYHILYQYEKKPADYLMLIHVIALLLLTAFIILESFYLIKHIAHLNMNYQSVAIILPAIIASYCCAASPRLGLWPFNRDGVTYPYYANKALFIIIIYLLLINFTQAGQLNPAPYIPILNILDVTLLLGLGALTSWVKFIHVNKLISTPYLKLLLIGLGLEYFICFNTIISRGLHHYLHVQYDFFALYNSVTAQMTYTLFWSTLALSCILAARYKQWRLVWLAGAWLIALVVLKLFIVDLANSNTLERIISFVMTGVILLLIGYFSPIPPKVASK